jgi:collagenase-like PrtC family protease
MTCPICYASISEGLSECPSCKKPLPLKGAITTAHNSTVENAISKKISEGEYLMFQKKIEQTGDLLSLIESGHTANLLRPQEVEGLLAKSQERHEQEKEDHLTQMMDQGIEAFKIEGIQLSNLMTGGGHAHVVKIIQTGVKLIKAKKLAEAAEWWRLQRMQSTVSPNSKTELLYLLLELLTLKMSTQHPPDHLLRQIRNHPEFSRSGVTPQ